MTTIVWLRRDLRLSDQPALQAAVQRGEPIIPVFIDGTAEEGSAARGGASRWWLHASLESLDLQLRQLGSRLILRQGPALATLLQLITEVDASAVVWNRCYEPTLIERDQSVKAAIKAAGCEASSYNGALLREPWEVRNGSGNPYRVFTPYWRACLAQGEVAKPLRAPIKLNAPASWPKSLALEQLGLKPLIPWDQGLTARWSPGAPGAHKLLTTFTKQRVAGYVQARDFPALDATSSLSPHLAFGEVSPRQIWHAFTTPKAALKPGPSGGEGGGGAAAFLRQIGWREFAYHLLFHYPQTVHESLRPEFSAFPWEPKPGALRRWQRGQTGYPIIDAGMRELWTTGTMHNRVRMLVGSFLVKDLLIPWQEGAAWFWDTLVDADLANNTLGWQWVAGCGADAAPYFRIFNPITQGDKFDAMGVYVRRWVPELARLPNKWIQHPFAAPDAVLQQAGVVLGATYPRPIVDHALARDKALLAYHRMPKNKDKDSAKDRASKAHY